MERGRNKSWPAIAGGLLLIGMAFCGDAPAQTSSGATPQASATEIEFWTTVKESRNPAELKAYLETYPSGAFAALARARIKALEEQAAARPAPAPPPAQQQPGNESASALTSSEIIREVQAKLFNLNYTVGPQNGTLTRETRDAIRRWQSNVGRAQTGDMSAAELEQLRRAKAPTTWGAVAYNVRGGSTAVWGRASRADAEATATTGCRNLKGGECRVLAAAETGCGSVAHAQGVRGNTRYRDAYAAIRPTLAQAIDSALTECRNQSRVGNNCGIRNTFCADGSHKR